MNKLYICICGKEFQSANALNSHKSCCKDSMIQKYGSWEAYQAHKNRNSSFCSQRVRESKSIQHQEYLVTKAKELEKWILEQHKCDRCGKIMTKFYGSGRFCSSKCSHGRSQSTDTRKKIGAKNKVISPATSMRSKNIKQYEENPSTCCICGATLAYDNKNKQTCSKECLSKLLKIVCNHEPNNSPRPQYKYGTYRGIACDSSWELAFVVYNMDRGIDISRNKDYFTYCYDNKQHRFYPDFKLDDTYYEIKGQWTEQETAKINCFPPELNLVVIDIASIGTYMKYCEETYGKNFAAILYEKDKPSYLDTVGVAEMVNAPDCGSGT